MDDVNDSEKVTGIIEEHLDEPGTAESRSTQEAGGIGLGDIAEEIVDAIPGPDEGVMEGMEDITGAVLRTAVDVGGTVLDVAVEVGGTVVDHAGDVAEVAGDVVGTVIGSLLDGSWPGYSGDKA